MNKPCCILYIIIIISFSACYQSERKAVQDKVISESIDSVFDFVAREFDLQKTILLHFEYYPNKLKKGSIENLLKSNIIQNPEEKKVIQQLVKEINDSVKYSFNNYNFRDTIMITTVVGLEEGTGNDKYFNDPSYFGTINISDSSSNGNFGCYYFALNCGNKCSVGLVITTEIKNGKWRVKNIFQAWKG